MSGVNENAINPEQNKSDLQAELNGIEAQLSKAANEESPAPDASTKPEQPLSKFMQPAQPQKSELLKKTLSTISPIPGVSSFFLTQVNKINHAPQSIGIPGQVGHTKSRLKNKNNKIAANDAFFGKISITATSMKGLKDSKTTRGLSVTEKGALLKAANDIKYDLGHINRRERQGEYIKNQALNNMAPNSHNLTPPQQVLKQKGDDDFENKAMDSNIGQQPDTPKLNAAPKAPKAPAPPPSASASSPG